MREAPTDAYSVLLKQEHPPYVAQAMAAATCPQPIGGEIEVSGYLTCDRAAEKMDAGRLRAGHEKLYKVPNWTQFEKNRSIH